MASLQLYRRNYWPVILPAMLISQTISHITLFIGRDKFYTVNHVLKCLFSWFVIGVVLFWINPKIQKEIEPRRFTARLGALGVFCGINLIFGASDYGRVYQCSELMLIGSCFMAKVQINEIENCF